MAGFSPLTGRLREGGAFYNPHLPCCEDRRPHGSTTDPRTRRSTSS